MSIRNSTPVSRALAVSLGLMLAGCNTGPMNTSLNSVNQPVVERANYALDLAAGAGGLPVSEQQRLADWFETMNLRYGDRVAIDGALSGDAVREDIAAITARHGLLLSDGAPVTGGQIAPGAVRVVVTRSHAFVPDCPNWSDQSGARLDNATTAGFGCAVNGNFAAMVADPEHLLKGAEGTGETVVMSSTKAISTYRATAPTGAGGLPTVSSQGGGS